MSDGTLETIDGRLALRFERTLAHPIERVWRALSEPDELGAWFPAAAPWGPTTGETFEAFGMTPSTNPLQGSPDAASNTGTVFGGRPSGGATEGSKSRRDTRASSRRGRGQSWTSGVPGGTGHALQARPR